VPTDALNLFQEKPRFSHAVDSRATKRMSGDVVKLQAIAHLLKDVASGDRVNVSSAMTTGEEIESFLGHLIRL